MGLEGTSVLSFAADGRVSATSTTGTRPAIFTNICRLLVGRLLGRGVGLPVIRMA